MGSGNEVKAVGSPNDVTMINRGAYDSFMSKLGGASESFSNGLSSNGSNAAQAFGRVSDTAGNYENFIKQMMGGGGAFEALRNNTNNFDPNSALNSMMSMNPQFARMADQSLSGLYDSTRSQASAAGADARRQAANDLASAGLLSSGGAVGAMTEATANPILQAETSLAQARANYLGGMQGNALQSLTSGYGQNLGLAGQIAGLGLGGMQGLTNAYAQSGQGQGQLASLFGGLYGQGLGYGAQMSAPEYWQPQYMNDKKGLDWAKGGTGVLSGAVAGTALNPLFGGLPVGTIGGGVISGLAGLFG